MAKTLHGLINKSLTFILRWRCVVKSTINARWSLICTGMSRRNVVSFMGVKTLLFPAEPSLIRTFRSRQDRRRSFRSRKRSIRRRSVCLRACLPSVLISSALVRTVTMDDYGRRGRQGNRETWAINWLIDCEKIWSLQRRLAQNTSVLLVFLLTD